MPHCLGSLEKARYAYNLPVFLTFLNNTALTFYVHFFTEIIVYWKSILVELYYSVLWALSHHLFRRFELESIFPSLS